ncbi:putative arylsulfatase [Periconia macrospinosa]|uniref:Arylsulfatase n=1 Tax=Periconia macrospinosa TaxID=97972 RepID=A0A2V1E5S6_9PLEO|nr:putative arylsulfatase [Periconia macrospinosa]
MLYAVFLHFMVAIAVSTKNSTDQSKPPGKGKPNFIIIMTDDQDLHLNSLDYQPAVQKHFTEQGSFYKKHYVTLAQCCPSRVSFLTGMAGHNTNVTDVFPPYGGYPKFISQGFNDNYLPVWLQQAGYNTYYTGKFLNAHDLGNWNKPLPKGWTGSDFLLDPYTYMYYNATLQRNQEPPKSYPGEYNTDLIKDRALGFLDEAAAADEPFFIGVMPIGPHTETTVPENPSEESLPVFLPPKPAKRHEHLYQGVKIPRTYNFNPDKPSGANYVRELPQQNETVLAYNDEFYRLRLASLAAVDDLINEVFEKLEEYDLLDNTYIIYTTDNGFHMGQHRMDPGKSCAYEEDVNVPMIIRGPGVPKRNVTSPTSHTDIVPTLFKLAGIPLLEQFDGSPMPITPEEHANAKTEHVNIELWGGNLGEGEYRIPVPTLRNTYKALRIVAEDYEYTYIVWCTNEHELYDMKVDPGQMDNLWDTENDDCDFPPERLQPRLDALLMVLKSCKGDVCVHPWKSIHPLGNVNTLKDAMSPEFDAFYASQPEVSFSECAMGYFPSAEGPQRAIPFIPREMT